MATQRHSTEITVTLDDRTVQESIKGMTRGFEDVTKASTQAFTQMTRASQETSRALQRDARGRFLPRGAPAPVADPKAPLQRDEKGRFLPRGTPAPPPKPPPTPLTALERISGGKPATALDDLASQGRARQEARLREAQAQAEQFTPSPSMYRRGLSMGGRVIGGVGAFGLQSGVTLGSAMLTGDASSFARGLGAVGGSGLSSLGLTRIAGALPVLGNLAGALISRRTQRIGQVAGRERLQTELALSGVEGLGTARRGFTRFGIGAEEGLGALRALQRAVGTRSDVFGAESIGAVTGGLSRAMLRGVDVGTLSQFVAGGAMGGGAGGTVRESLLRAGRIMGTGQEMGLTGAGISRLLGLIASNTSRLAQEGLTLDEEASAQFIRGIDIEARRQGVRQVQGIGAGVAFNRLTGALGGVSGSFAGQFGGLGRGALLASASRGARSPLEVQRRLEEFRRTPSSAIEALRAQGFEGEMLDLALVGLGLSTEQAGIVSRAGRSDLSSAIRGERGTMARGMQFSRMLQGQRERLVSTVARDPSSAQAILRLNEQFEKFALSFTEGNSALIQGLEAVQPVVTTLIEGVGDLRDMISDLQNVMRGIKDFL